MMTIGLHLRIIGRPAKIGGLDRVLAHMRAKGGVWYARRDQIAMARASAAGPTPTKGAMIDLDTAAARNRQKIHIMRRPGSRIGIGVVGGHLAAAERRQSQIRSRLSSAPPTPRAH